MQNNPIYLDTSKSFEERVEDLVSRIPLKEKILHLTYKSPGNKKLGIKQYDWWNECLHGVARAGIATVFPQSIGLGATFNDDLIFKMADIISTEARAKHHEFQRKKNYSRYTGLTFWSPNINIFRDPRWGRGQETYGECPYLTGRLGVAFIKGLQGDDPKYMKVVATSKHYAVHSGPEKDRHHFNAVVSDKDLRETYLPHFKDSIVEAKAYSVMGAYNRTNYEPCCASTLLIQTILRNEWGFEGYFVSDCGAIRDFHAHHKVTKDGAESAALGVKKGCDLDCGIVYRDLNKSLKRNLITEEEINVSVKRLFLARFKLGMFDPPEMVPYAQIPYSKNDCEDHRQFALEVARQTIVLLKNENKFLPLDSSIGKILVTGPNADNLDSLLGNYNGDPSRYTTPLQGLRNLIKDQNKLIYAKGGDYFKNKEKQVEEALNLAKQPDIKIIFAFMGISPKFEGEEGFIKKDDREDVNLPENQLEYLKRLAELNKPIVLVLMNGSPISSVWAQENIPAILEAWYPGEEGGQAIAEVLFGQTSPAGRLPITFVKDVKDLPEFTDYRMDNRTYRYIETDPLYPFGFGLSYAKFEYSNLESNKKELDIGEKIQLKFNVANNSKINADEVIQIYFSHKDTKVKVPKYQLIHFQRTNFGPNESKEITIDIEPKKLSIILENGTRVLEPGTLKMYIGGSLPDNRSVELMGKAPLKVEVSVKGNRTQIEY
jgi:beta-glucosidase